MDHKDRMIKSVFIVTAFSILGKMTGFLRETIIAAYYGAGATSDAYFVAFSLPSILFFVIGASMGVIFVPMYTQRLKEDSKGSHEFASNIISMVLLIGLIFSILGIIFSRYIIMLIAPRLSDQNLSIATRLAKIMFPMFIFISLSYIVTGVLQSHESFLMPSLISIPSNLIIILGTVLFSKAYGIYALGWGTLIGAGAQLAVQLPSVRKKLKYKFFIRLSDPSIIAYWKLIIPVVSGAAIDKISIMVDNMLASSLVAGSISAINYSAKLVDFADSIAIGAIIVVVYPRLAKMNAEKDYDSLARTSYNAIIGISQIIIPIIAATVILNKDIVKLIFQRGAFQESHTDLTAYAFLYYAFGMWGIGIRGILTRVFYALEDTRTPMKVSIGTLVSNIVLNILLVKYMGIGGLGLASSISSTMGVLVLLYLARKNVANLTFKGIGIEGFKIALAVFFMVYGMLIFRSSISIDSFYTQILLSYGIGFAIYGGLSYALGIGLLYKIKPSKKYSDITSEEYGKDRLWKMRRREIETYRILRKSGLIGFLVFALLMALSYIKYIGKLAIEAVMYAVKSLNRREL
ncbi:MAG TPA: murein biosynthesis integral membrane protein MurJ [Clostridia bacterium]|nr:murein biosynthesis integral membrane protein MurJ [Clostridia bacterium]